MGANLEAQAVQRDDRLGAGVHLAERPARDGGSGGRSVGRHGARIPADRRQTQIADIGTSVNPFAPLRRAWAHRALVSALVRRELSARYRGGTLGFLWTFLNPLLLLLVYATVFRFVFAPRADVRPFALFLFGGVLLWGFASAALTDAAECFRANGPLLRKTRPNPFMRRVRRGRRRSGPPAPRRRRNGSRGAA